MFLYHIGSGILGHEATINFVEINQGKAKLKK